MSIRVKTLMVIGVILGALLALISYFANTVLLQSCRLLEQRYLATCTQRACVAVDHEFADLAKTLGDWAPRDETYTFAAERNADYITANLADETLANLRINLIVYVDTAGRVIYAKAVNLQQRRAMPAPKAVLRALTQRRTWYHHPTPQTVHSGVIALPGLTMLVASHPIVRNDFTGAVRGTLLMGRTLDDQAIRRISALVQHDVAIRQYHATTLPREWSAVRAQLSSNRTVVVRPLGADRVAGYVRIDDTGGSPALLLRVTTTRAIYRQGVDTIRVFLVVLLVTGAVLGLAMAGQLEYVVLARLATLNAEVKHVSARRDFSSRIPVRHRRRFADELDSLGGNVNDMLEALESAHMALAEEQVLRESENRYRALIEHSPNAVFIVTEGRCVFANANGALLLGAPCVDTVIGQSVAAALTPEDRRTVHRQFRQLLHDQSGEMSAEISLRRFNGTVVAIEAIATPFVFRERPAIQIVAHDISDRRRAEQAIQQYQQRLRAMSAELSLAEEKERKRIAGDLHDHIGQSLAASRLMLGVLRDSMESAEANAAIDEVRLLLGQAIEWSRTLTHDLSPPVLHARGLVAAVHWLREQVQERHGLRVSVEACGPAASVSTEVRAVLYRAVRELLLNIVKHAHATTAMVSIILADDTVRLVVTDDGSGFDLAKVDAGTGFGLFSIRERIQHWGGQVEIISQPGTGTRVSLCVPMHGVGHGGA